MFEFFGLLVRAISLAAPLAFAIDPVPADSEPVASEPAMASTAPIPLAVPVAFPGRIGLKSYTMTLVGAAPSNGDNDGYADAGETVDLTPTSPIRGIDGPPGSEYIPSSVSRIGGKA